MGAASFALQSARTERERASFLAAAREFQRVGEPRIDDGQANGQHWSESRGSMTVKRMDNIGIVVESLDAAIPFFTELGLELEGRTTIEGTWAGRVTGLGDQRVEIAMMRTPDGHSRLELSRFLAPPVVADHRNAPVNALGYLRVMFTVEDLDDTLARISKRGAQLVGEVVQYEDVYRLCYHPGARRIAHRARRRARVTPDVFSTLPLITKERAADRALRASTSGPRT